MELKIIMKCLPLLLLSIHSIFSESCPAPENITPCVCVGKDTNLQVHCSRVQSLKSLLTSVRGMSGHTIINFAIENSIFDYLPFDIFENVTIRHISIKKSNFSRIGNLGDPQFFGLEHSLESLKFEDTFNEWHPFAFVSLEHLKTLRSLQLRKGYVGLVHNLWFKDGPVSLEEIRFVEGQITNIQYKAFQPLKNLRILDLSENKISYIIRSMLPSSALHLEEIILERNNVQLLPADIFDGMPKLQRVNLELNELSTIDQNVWTGVWNRLSFLNIVDNPIVCDKNISWLYSKGNSLDGKLVGTCYKPFDLMDRELDSLEVEELK